MGVLTGLSAAKISQLTTAQIKALSAADLAGLTAAQLPGFSKSQMQYLAIPAIAGLTPTQIGLLSSDQVSGFTGSQIAALSVAQFTAFTAADIAGLSTSQVAALTTAQIAALKTTQFASLSAADIGALSIAQIKALTSTQLSSLSTSQLTGLSARDIAALSPSQIASLAPADIAALSAPQLKALSAAQLGALTKAQLGNLNAAQIALLTPSALGGFSEAQIAALSAAQIAGLTASQINALSAAQLASLKIDYNSMLGILEADAAGGVTATEFKALKALVGKFNTPDGIMVSGYLQQISEDVVLGNPGNATWTGGSAYSTYLGNLMAGSTQTQVDELIGKWFLGTDLPSSRVSMAGLPDFTVSYSAVSSPLFGAGGPRMTDVNQGFLGDCFVLAPLAEMAAQDPSAIQSMITVNGNNSYGICFTIGGEREYVTVDNRLANGGTIFNSGTNDWASLIEKAYAQLQAEGILTGDNFTYGNSFSSIGNGGCPEMTLAELTGATTITDFVAKGLSWSSYSYDAVSLSTPNSGNSAIVKSSGSGLTVDQVQGTLIADLAAGDELILSSFTDAVDKNGNTTLVANHAMAVYGFDAATNMFEIYNPWGTESGAGQYWDTSFEIGLKTLLADGDTISVASDHSTGGMAGGLPTPKHSTADPLPMAGLSGSTTSPLGPQPSSLGLAAAS